MGVYFQLQLRNQVSIEDLGILPVCILCVFIFGVSFGVNPIVYTIMGEIFGANVKDLAAIITMNTGQVVSTLVTVGFPYLTSTVDASVSFFVFSAFAALFFVFVIFLVPETKGKTFQDIQKALVNKW